MLTNKMILTNLFSAIIRVMSASTSNTYAVTSLTNVIMKNFPQFPFVRYLSLSCTSSGENINLEIDERINEISPGLVGQFITRIINTLFVVDTVKNTIVQEMNNIDNNLINELQSMGVII